MAEMEPVADRQDVVVAPGSADFVDRLAARIASPSWNWSCTLQLAFLVVVCTMSVCVTLAFLPSYAAYVGGAGGAARLAYAWVRRRRR